MFDLADTGTKCVHADGPSFAAAYYKNGKCIFRQQEGLANVEHQSPITQKTAFNLGSVSKHFTALAILLLEDAGELGLDDPISRYLPDHEGGRTTLQDLLNHESHWLDFPHWFFLAFHSSTNCTPTRHDGFNLAADMDCVFARNLRGAITTMRVGTLRLPLQSFRRVQDTPDSAR